MTRLSTGYTFLNIQEHSRFIRENIENKKNVKKYEIRAKYKFLDKILLRVLNRHHSKYQIYFLKCLIIHQRLLLNFYQIKVIFFRTY